MFRKSEIDKHVKGILYKAKNENERNLRCFHIAKLYYKIQDYESVQHYINMYLSACDDSAAAHKLLGQALEGLGQKEKALSVYTKSLKLESDQADLVSKVCDLLCDKDVEFDPARARYWSDRASFLFPHSLPVLMLKEKLLTADSSIPLKDLEELLHAELKAKPTDVSVRIKLLKTYAESGRIEMAINHAFEVESRQAHTNCLAWYQCINNICKVYNRDQLAKCGWEFYVQWLAALDRMCLLSLTDNMPHSCDLSEAVDCVYSLDQSLYYAHLCPVRPEKFEHFLKVMSAQVSYLLGVLLMKKAKKDQCQWKEAKRLVGPLFILVSNTSFKLDQSWTSNLKDSLQRILEFWVHQVHCRQAQAGHVLLCLVKENTSEKMFLDKVSHFNSGDWRGQIYKKLFSNISDFKTSTSHFLTGAEYVKFPLKIPSSNILKPIAFVPSFENTYFGSLHHLVWLGLRTIKKPSILEMKLHSFRCTSFKSLQFTINNLNNISVETINQLDVDTFLYTTVFCTASILEENKTNGYSNEDKPQVLPADISSPLCSGEQGKWWSNLCTLVKKGPSFQVHSNETMSDLRFRLQRGLEVVRGEGLPPILIVALARTFSTRAAISSTVEETDGCQARALHLWQMAYPMLERLVFNKSYFPTSKMHPLFEYPIKNISPQEAKSLFDEAKFFIGSHYLNSGEYEKAVDELKGIRSPQASFKLGLTYQRWAEQQVDGFRGEDITSEIRCRHEVLATKARDYLIEARSMIRNDPKNSLHGDIETQLSEVEDMLSRIELENGTKKDINGTSGTPSTGSGSPEVLHNLTTSNQRNTRYHTSTPYRAHEQIANRFNMSELIELLSVQQSTNQLKMQQVLEQIRLVTEKLDVVASEQRIQRNVIDGLTSRWSTFESEMRSNLSDIKKDIKRPELCNVFDEDEYTDEMLQYPGYSQYYGPTQRVVQNTAAPPPTVPYVNQYFSPRMDPVCQGYYSQGALPFSEGQQLPDFLRQQKVNQPSLHSLQPGIPSQLNLATGVPGPSRAPTGPSLPTNVLLTADTLSSGTPPVPAQLSVNIPTNRLATTPSNLPHNFQIPLPPHSKPVLTIEERLVEDETPPPTYDPLPDYKPLVPLPDEIEVHTGEEEEEVLFERRSKLYRYIDKMWKERGVGNLKILKNKSSGKIRILMRREQVHKICANHFLTPDMELQPKANTANTWLWCATDFADEKIQIENFCAKFKTQEDSDEFKDAFDRAKEDLESYVDTSLPEYHSSFSDQPNIPKITGQFTIPKHPSQPTIPKISEQTGIPSASGQSIVTPFQVQAVPMLPPPIFGFNSVPLTSTSSPFFSATSFNFAASSFPSTAPSFSSTAPSFSSTASLFSSTPLSFSSTAKPSVPEEKVMDSALFSSSSQVQTPNQPAKLGGFTFLAQPKLKAPEVPKHEDVEAAIEPSPFVKFKFGSISSDPPKDSFSNMFSNLGSDKKIDFPNPFAISSATKSSGSSPSNGKSDEKASENEKEKSDVPKSLTPKDDGEVDNFVPTATFQPVIPLPELVALKTGEENEAVIYEDRAQLYRYVKDTKEWKERGTGQMKILKFPESESYRFLMRREQVFKVCCNHRITNDIHLKPLSSSEKAFTWGAKDYSEDTPTDEVFSLKFKNSEQARKFKEAFDKVKRKLKNDNGAPVNLKISDKPSLSSVIKKPVGSWDCKMCFVQNKAGVDVCAACSTEKPKESSMIQTKPEPVDIVTPNKTSSQLSLAELLKPDSGSWECGQCYLRNKPEVVSCVSCNETKPGSIAKDGEGTKQTPSFSFGIPETTDTESKFTFGIPPFSVPMVEKPSESLFTAKYSTTASDVTSSAGSPFSFSGGFSVGAVPTTPVAAPANTPGNTGFVFSSPAQQSDSSNQEFAFGSQIFQFALPQQNVPTSPGNASEHDESGGYDPEEEVEFQLVAPPLLSEVDVVTGEENENVLYSQRAKLFRHDPNAKEWKERGIGNVKILQHKETGKVRFLMRREQVMKVCLNHIITPDITLSEKGDKTWMWGAADFSEGVQTNESLAIRFKTPDIAQAFKDEVDKAKLLADSPSSTTIAKHEGELTKDTTDVSSTSSDNDVEFVCEQEAVRPELVEKALALKLPPNYYSYLDKPRCPGCDGCESDDNESEEETTGKQEEATKLLFKISEEKKQDLLSKKIFAAVEPAFGGSPTFSFAKDSSSPSGGVPGFVLSPFDSSKGLFFSQDSFGSTAPQQNIFLSGTSSPLINAAPQDRKETTSMFGSGGQKSTSSPLTNAAPQDRKQTTSMFGSGGQKSGGQQAPEFLSESFQTFSALSEEGRESLAEGDENFKWEGAGLPVFGGQPKKKEGKNKADSTNKQTPQKD